MKMLLFTVFVASAAAALAVPAAAAPAAAPAAAHIAEVSKTERVRYVDRSGRLDNTTAESNLVNRMSVSTTQTTKHRI